MDSIIGGGSGREMEALGISRETIDKACEKIRHPSVDFLLKMEEEHPEPDLAAVAERRQGFSEFFKRFLKT